MSKALFVPIHVDGLYLKSGRHGVKPFGDFTRLPYVAKDAAGREWDANASVPWLTESVVSKPLSALEAKLEPGVHLHWALPDALTRATHPLGKDGQPDRNKLEFPPVPNRWLVVRRVSGVAQKRWLIESDYLWPADYPWGMISKDDFTANFPQQGQAIWAQLLASGWLNPSQDGNQAVVVDAPARRSNDLGPYQAFRADILRALHEKSAEPRRTEFGLVSYPYPNVLPDSRPKPGEPPFRYMGRKRVIGESWRQEGRPEYLKDRLTAVGYGEPTFAAFYPNCRSVFGFHDAVEASAHSHQYDVFGWYSAPSDDVLTAFVFDEKAKAASGHGLAKEEQFLAWLEKRFNWTLDPESASMPPEATICYGRVRSGSFIAAISDKVKASIVPAVREADPATRQIKVPPERPKVHVAVANTGTEALSAYLADQLARKRHPGDGHARAIEKQKIEEYLEALQLSDDLEHRLLDVGAKFAEKRHNKGFTASPGGTIWLIRAKTVAPPLAEAPKIREPIDLALPPALGHQLNALNQAQGEYERGRRSIEAMRWQVYSDWYRYMRNAYPPDDEALDYAAARDHQDVDIMIAYLRHGGMAVLDDLIVQTGELTQRDPATGPAGSWRVSFSGSNNSLAGVLAGHIHQVSATVGEHNRQLPADSKTYWLLEPAPAPRFYQANDPVVLLAGGLAQPTDRHGEDGRRHAKGHLECHTVEGDFTALQAMDAKRVDRAVVAFDLAVNGLLAKLERDEPARVGFRRGRRPAGHAFMLEWQVEIAPVRSGGNMSTGNRRFDPWFIRNNWGLGENDCALAEQAGLTTHTHSCSVLRGRGFFTPQAKTLLQGRLEIYLLRRLKEYFESCNVPKNQQHLHQLRQNYLAVRAWFVSAGADSQAAADGRELDLLQQAAPDKAVHGIIDHEKSAIAPAILRVVNNLPGSVLEEAVGLDPLTAQTIVIRRSGPAFLLKNYLPPTPAGEAGPDTRKQLLDQLKLDAELRPPLTGNFDNFVNYLMGGMTKQAFVDQAKLDDQAANRLPEPAAGLAALVDTLRGNIPRAQLYEDDLAASHRPPPFRFENLKALNSLQIMQANAGAGVFARIIRFAHFNGYFGPLLNNAGIDQELPGIYGLPPGGPIEAGLLKLLNEADEERLLNRVRLAPNVVTELLQARPIRSLSHLVEIPLVGRREVALLLHFADADVQYIHLEAEETSRHVGKEEIGDQFASTAPGGHAWSDPILTAIDAWYALNSGFHCVSQALTGFNDALLMRRRCWQLPVADPLTFTEYQAFTEKIISRAVGRQIASPETFVDFHPIRSGDMKITRLRLVDTFGQSSEIQVDDVVTTNQMYTSRLLGVALPPRLTQPARLNFRWLDAAGGGQEWNQHPATTPICGWLVLNNLAAQLMIYNTDGGPLGSIDQLGHWRPPPGPSGGVTTPDDIENKPLRRMVKWFCHEAKQRGTNGSRFIEEFLAVVESGLEKIDPEGFQHQEAQSLLLGRPLALVRAAVSIECRDPLAVQQSLEAFGRELQGQPRSTDDFERVRFPVRIGEHMQLNDGVVGYWPEEGQDYAVTYQVPDGHDLEKWNLPVPVTTALATLGAQTYVGLESFLDALEDLFGTELTVQLREELCQACARGRHFFAPQSEWAKGEEDNNLMVYREGQQALNLWLPISGQQIVSILMDPRASVHATCGILPTKELNLPAHEYTAALNSINVSFLTAPLLTERGRINLPLPKAEGWEWSWIANRDGQWTTTPSTPLVHKAAFQKAFGPDKGQEIWGTLLEKGWITSIGDRGEEAMVAPAQLPNGEANPILRNGRSATDLGNYEPQAEAILRVIELSSRAIGRVSAQAHFAEQELAEGWLLLNPRQGTATDAANGPEAEG